MEGGLLYKAQGTPACPGSQDAHFQDLPVAMLTSASKEAAAGKEWT